MKARMVSASLTVVALAAGGAMVSAQGQLLPSTPKLGFGASVTPAYDGWYDNADGTHTFLIGYYNRNWTRKSTSRSVRTITSNPAIRTVGSRRTSCPTATSACSRSPCRRTFARDRTPVVDATINGVTSRVGMILSPDYNITPQKASEEAPNGKYNAAAGACASLKAARPSRIPVATVASAIVKTATVGVPMPLDLFVEDDALYASGTNAPMTRTPPVVEADGREVSRPGNGDGRRASSRSRRSRAASRWSRTPARRAARSPSAPPATTSSTSRSTTSPRRAAARPGCCWTTAMVKVNVKPGAGARTTGQQ